MTTQEIAAELQKLKGVMVSEFQDDPRNSRSRPENCPRIRLIGDAAERLKSLSDAIDEARHELRTA